MGYAVLAGFYKREIWELKARREAVQHGAVIAIHGIVLLNGTRAWIESGSSRKVIGIGAIANDWIEIVVRCGVSIHAAISL